MIKKFKENLFLQLEVFKGLDVVITGTSGAKVEWLIKEMGFKVHVVTPLHNFRNAASVWWDDKKPKKKQFVFVDDHIDSGVTLKYVDGLCPLVGVVMYHYGVNEHFNNANNTFNLWSAWDRKLYKIPNYVQIWDGRCGKANHSKFCSFNLWKHELNANLTRISEETNEILINAA